MDASVFCILHNAHDRERLVDFANCECLFERLLWPPEKLAGETLIHHDNFYCGGSISLIEDSASHKRKLQRREVGGRDMFPFEAPSFALLWLISRYVDGKCVVGLGQDRVVGHTDRLHARLGAECLKESFVQSRHRGRLITGQTRIELERKQMICYETHIDRLEIAQRAAEQSGSHEQYQAKTNLHAYGNPAES